jgi:hypothetical protein
LKRLRDSSYRLAPPNQGKRIYPKLISLVPPGQFTIRQPQPGDISCKPAAMSNDTPGTVRLFAETGEYLYDEPQLIPTPSQSPDDPLNWSKGRKALCLSCLLMWVSYSG